MSGERPIESDRTVLIEWEVPVGSGPETAARQLAAAAVGAEFPDEPRLREDVELVTSELVTNACRVALDSVGIRVTAERDMVTVSVTDDGPGEPQPLHPDPDDPVGRGLLVVGAVAQDWGLLRADAISKTVWARCARSAPG